MKEKNKEGVAEGREFGFVQFSETSGPMVSTSEKSLARQTLNDASSPQVNGTYLIFIPPFDFSMLFKFSPLHNLN